MKNYIFLTGNFNSGTIAGFVNKGFLFATSSIRIKSHVVESQITLLVWSCLSLTENIAMIQSVSFTSAAFRALFLVYASEKKKKKKC